MSKIHELKTHPLPFQAVKRGEKNFELRFDDRGYRVGDQLLLKEYTPANYWDPEEPKESNYTGEILHREISYILKDFKGLEQGYVILGLRKI